MDKYGFLFVIDIRGTPYGKITLGLGSFLVVSYNDLIKEFKKNFPEFRRSRNKACVLKKSKLKDIIKFLNVHKVHMKTLHFSGEDWRFYKQKYSNKAYFKEKIMACLYFQILKQVSSVNHKFAVIVDNDSWMDVNRATSYVKKLAKANNYDFDFTIGRATQNDLIRIVDFIASSYDKIDKKILEKLKYHSIIESEIPAEFLKKLFK